MDDSTIQGRAARGPRQGGAGAVTEDAGRSSSQSGAQPGVPRSASSASQSAAGLSSLGASTSGVQARWLGKRVGRFRLVSVLGKGAYGRVFLAEDVDLQRRVALKVITAEATSKSIREEAAAAGEAMDSSRLEEAVSQAVERMIREARAAARMEHPNVVHVYEIGRLEGSGLGGYIAMELLDGGTLQDLIRAAGPMDVARACTLVADAADALQHGHDMGVIHRDVKPANLMLSRAGRCKVADFGLACVDDPNDCHRHMPIAGTALFLAPEIMSGALPDPKTDQYSLGVTLFTLLAGRPPYVGNRKQVLEAHVRSPVPDLLVVRPDLDPKLFQVIRRAMSKDPGKRFPNIRQFGQALRLFTVAMAPQPVAAPAPLQATVVDSALAAAASGTLAHSSFSSRSPQGGPAAKEAPIWPMVAAGVGVLVILLGLILWGAGVFSGAEPDRVQLAELPPLPAPNRDRVSGSPQAPTDGSTTAGAQVEPEVPQQLPAQVPSQQPTQPVTPPKATQEQSTPPPEQAARQGAAEKPAQEAAPKEAGGAPLPAGAIAPADRARLMQIAQGKDPEHATKRATVVGRVISARASSTGKVFRITFVGAEGMDSFGVVYFPRDNLFQRMEDKFGGSDGSGMEGKTIRVTGNVSLYEGNPQIVVNGPDQIEIVDAAKL